MYIFSYFFFSRWVIYFVLAQCAPCGCCVVAHSVCHYDDVVSSASFSLFIISVCLCFSSCLAVPLWAMRFHNIHRRFHCCRMQRVWARLDSTRSVCECVKCARFFNFDFIWMAAISFHAIVISCVGRIILYGHSGGSVCIGLAAESEMRTVQTADRHMLMG